MTVGPEVSSRLNPTDSDTTRTPRATRGATRHNVVDDAELAMLVEVWPELPEAIRAGILAMVKAAAK
jgi:hypothetical protein